MSEKLNRDRVRLGLIGLGPGWEETYRDALARLQKRVCVRVIYDPVEARARTVAAELEADVVSGLRQALVRPTVQGLLVLDLGWCGAGALGLIARCNRPVFLAKPVLEQLVTLSEFLESNRTAEAAETAVSRADDWLMPELGLRFTPASCRLRELVAAKIGTVRHIQIECNRLAGTEVISGLVDWCSNLMGHDPIRVIHSDESAKVTASFKLEYRAVSPSTVSRTATLIQRSNGDNSIRITVECEQGCATLTDRTKISWQSSTESADEVLTGERSEIDILIDQFCRRAIGGLNPVGRLGEFIRAVRIAQSLRQNVL